MSTNNTSLSFPLSTDDLDCQESKFGSCPYICCSEVEDISYEEYLAIWETVEADNC
jgi:hypothetical protein